MGSARHAALQCPVCQRVSDDPYRLQAIALCPNCGTTLHVDGAGTVRRATLEDLRPLRDKEMRALKAARRAVIQ